MEAGEGSLPAGWSVDEAPCPFCGRNAVWWSGGNDYPCEHLVVGWALDPGDNGGGVLGEMLSLTKGIADAERLAELAGDLCAWVWSGGKVAVEERLRLAADAVVGEKPAWWSALDTAILEYGDPDAILDYYGPDPEIGVDLITLAGDFANPLAEAVVQNLPGITVTYATIGGMTSGDDIFAWSEDPVAGRARIDAAFASAVSTMEMVLAAVVCDS